MSTTLLPSSMRVSLFTSYRFSVMVLLFFVWQTSAAAHSAQRLDKPGELIRPVAVDQLPNGRNVSHRHGPAPDGVPASPAASPTFLVDRGLVGRNHRHADVRPV